ncbi:MAG TPA: Hsp20/alpha crystallin family protein [Verrucomicrobiales bacterium]|nr:Hsp20/alpha crystallin family protein [Verrucomicrobiales bacterium]
MVRLLAEAEKVANELQGLHFARFHPPAGGWEPALNCYLCSDHYVLCVDLAGVAKETIDLRVEPHRVFLAGTRASPEPPRADGPCRRLLSLEIENGPFQRIVDLARPIDPARAQARQDNGLLWINLPLASTPTPDA